MSNAEKENVCLEFNVRDITVVTKKEKKTILKNVYGKFNSGRLVAILGPSGCGKTTLLNVLSGRMSNTYKKNGGVFDLSVSINQCIVDPRREMNRIAYVMSDDILRPALTCRETLDFCASLRLYNIKTQERKDAVDSLVTTLGLDTCKDVMIGDHSKKGISSGERKRTAIASDLIHRPSIIFLDEPTSSLDSYTAFKVVQSLKNLSDEGCIVVCTVHQPSSEIFSLFDDCFFLSDGECLYSGPTENITTFLGSQNYICPQNYNVCDFVLFLTQNLNDEAKRKLFNAASKENTLKQFDGIEFTSLLLDGNDGNTFINNNNNNTLGVLPTLKKAPIVVQLKQLMRLEFTTIRRDKLPLIARLCISLLFSAVYGIVFYQTFDGNSDDPIDILANFGVVGVISLTIMMEHSMAGMLTFTKNKPIYKRETANGLYGPFAYLISQTLFEIPIGMIQTFLNVSLIGFLAGISGNFGLTFLFTWLLGFTASSLSVLISSLIDDTSITENVVHLLCIPQMMFMGIFIPISKIPNSVRWLRHIMPLNYALNIITVNVFGNKPDDWEWFERNSIDTDMFYPSIAILVSFLVILRVLTLLSLQKRARNVLN